MKKTILATLVIAVVFTTVMLSCDTGGGSKDPAHTHDWEWVETAPATATADILETETCKTCGAVSGQTRIKFQKNFSITLLDKTVTVTDARTGASDQTLEQLGVMQKLRDAVALINTSTTIDQTVFDRVLAKGMVIEFDSPATISQTYRTKGDGKTMILDINYISSSACPAYICGGFIILAVRDYLDQELEKVS